MAAHVPLTQADFDDLRNDLALQMVDTLGTGNTRNYYETLAADFQWIVEKYVERVHARDVEQAAPLTEFLSLVARQPDGSTSDNSPMFSDLIQHARGLRRRLRREA